MKIVNLLWIHLSERTRKKIRLLLIVAFHDNPVAALDHGFESLDHLVLRQNRTSHPWLNALEPTSLLVPSGCPRGPLSCEDSITHSTSPFSHTPIGLLFV